MGDDRGYYSVPKSELRLVRRIVSDLLESIRVRRRQLGMTQEDLAEALGMSVESIKAMEQGKRVPSLPTLIRVSRKLGLYLFLSGKNDGS